MREEANNDENLIFGGMALKLFLLLRQQLTYYRNIVGHHINVLIQ
jgi:hypothetical protein